MSSTAKPASKVIAPNAGATATTAVSVASEKPPAQDKTAASDERKSHQRRRRPSKAPRGAQAFAQSYATKPATNRDVQVKEKQTDVQVGGVTRATDGKRDSTTDVLRKPRSSKPAILSPELAKAAASSLSPGSSEYPASSPSPAATPDKRRKGRQSPKALDELLENRVATAAEPSQASVAPKRYRFPYETKMLLAVSVIVVILGFTFLLLYQKPKPRRVQFCVTKGCQKHRDHIEAQIDKDVNPCEDFRAYVCGHWTGSGEAYQSRSQMNDMRLHWLHMFPETLRKGVVRFPAGRKVDAMFKSCMAQKGPKIAIIKKFMKARGILWPEKSPEGVPPAMALFDLSFN